MPTYDRNHLINGRFLQNLNGWTPLGGAAYLASDGDEHYGIANLPVGSSISQSFAVDNPRSYSLHVACKSPSGTLTAGKATLAIVDGSGLTVVTVDLAGGTDWVETIYTLGLGPGTTYELILTNVSAPGDIRIDDIWLWFVPITRAKIASETHTKLGRIAIDRSLSPASLGALTEGSYTFAVDAALRSVAAIDPETGTPDVRWLNENLVSMVIDACRREMLVQVQSDYALEVDSRVGPYQQSLSQKRAAITEMLGGSQDGAANSGGIVVRRMSYD